MPNLQELIQETRETGGFSYYSWHADTTLGGCHELAQKGFRADQKFAAKILNETDSNFYTGIITHNSERSHKQTNFNEVVGYKKLVGRRKTGQKQVDVRKTGFFGLKKEPVFEDMFEDVIVQTQDYLERGTEEEASQLFYACLRQERDGGNRDSAIVWSLQASTKLIQQLLKGIRDNPKLAYKLFEGVFPELEKVYHRSPNGRMLIGGDKYLMSRTEVYKFRESPEDLIVEYKGE